MRIPPLGYIVRGFLIVGVVLGIFHLVRWLW